MGRARTDLVELRGLLARRTKQAAAAAVQDGAVPADTIEELSRLERLVRLQEASQSSERWRRTIPLVAIITLLTVSFLLFTQVGSMPVELDLTVSEIGFVVSGDQPLSNPMSATSARISGLTSFQLPDAERRPASFLLLNASPGSPAGTVDVNPLTVPAGTAVLLRPARRARTYELIIQGAVPNLTASVNGSVEFGGARGFREQRAFASPRRVEFATDPDELRLTITLSDTARTNVPLWTPLPVRDLSLTTLDRFETPDRPLVRSVSTIRSGTVFFEALAGQSHVLRPGEELRFGSSRGEIREWRLGGGDSGISLRFHGVVSGLSTGSEGAKRSLMPSRLEWARAQQGVFLLWVTTAYIVGAFSTILGWWRRQP